MEDRVMNLEEQRERDLLNSFKVPGLGVRSSEMPGDGSLPFIDTFDHTPSFFNEKATESNSRKASPGFNQASSPIFNLD